MLFRNLPAGDRLLAVCLHRQAEKLLANLFIKPCLIGIISLSAWALGAMSGPEGVAIFEILGTHCEIVVQPGLVICIGSC